jgi:hypothetical protein
MSTVLPTRSTAPPVTTHVQSLLMRLNGITASDYLAWVRDPEPSALDQWLRSVAISAEPLGELITIELTWACQPPMPPSAAAVAAGFARTPEVVEVIGTTCAIDVHARPTAFAPRRSAQLCEPWTGGCRRKREKSCWRLAYGCWPRNLMSIRRGSQRRLGRPSAVIAGATITDSTVSMISRRHALTASQDRAACRCPRDR